MAGIGIRHWKAGRGRASFSVNRGLIGVVLACTLPLFLFSALILSQYASTREAASRQHILSFSNVVALAVDSTIGDGFDAVDGLSRSPALAHGNLAWFFTRCKQSAAHLGDGTWVVLLDARGQQVLSTGPQHKAHLDAVRPYLAQAAQSRQPVLTDYLALPSDAGRYVAIVAAVRKTESGPIEQYVVMGLNLESISKMTAKMQLPEDWMVVVLDKSYRILGRSANPSQAYGKLAHSVFVQQVRNRAAGTLASPTFDNSIDTVGAFTRMPRTGWIAAVGVEEDTFYKPTRDALAWALFGGAFLTIIGFATAKWMSHRVSGPMSDLVAAARNLGEGRTVPMRRALRLAETREVAQVLLESSRRIRQATDERERVLEDLQALTATLEERVVERTKEVERAWHAAENANQAKSDFLARVSHEIRTPLSGVLGTVDLLLASDVTGAQKERLLLLKRTCVSLKRLLGDILDFAKIQANRLELEDIPFSPHTVVADAVKLMEGAAADKSIQIEVKAQQMPARVMGDSHRVRQVLTNLLTNALTHTREGSITVTARGLNDGRVLEFEVRDTGVGLSEHIKAQLFEPYPLGSASSARQYNGVGLGLSIAKQLVTAMGGTISADGAPGQGATFTFTICVRPLCTVQADEGEQSAANRPAIAGRVLVAEDNLLMQELVVDMLTSQGHLVDRVSNGAQAVDAVRSQHYDAVLMDIQMPVMDGIAAAAAIRAMGGEKAQTYIIALSSDGARVVRRSGSSPFDEFESKPIDWQRLGQKIQRGIASQLTKEGIEPAPSVAPAFENILELPVLDTGVLQRLQEKLGDERLVSLIGTMPTAMTGQLQQVTQAVERGDTASAEAAAHSLHGSAVLMGLPQLAEAAQRMQQAPSQEALLAMQSSLSSGIREARGWSSRHLVSGKPAGLRLATL